MTEKDKARKRVNYKKRYLDAKKELEAREKKLVDIQKKLFFLEEKFSSQEKELASVDEEAREYLEHLKRLKAEFENYKKRSLKDRKRIISLSNEELIREFLPVMDDLERALGLTKEKKKSKEFSSFVEGIEMIFSQLKTVLEKQGLKQIKAQGERFDPHFHEAVMRVELDKYPDDFVVEEMRKGYKLNDRLLRPSAVKVNKKSEKAKVNKKSHKE